MLPFYIKRPLITDDKKVAKLKGSFEMPRYNPAKHYKNLTNSNYYHALVILRHYVKLISDYYFGNIQKAKNMDLFMFTPSVSSPIGPGSDSKPLKFNFGKLKTNLVDSSQFGFEPLLMNGFKKVYCYLPSMRGEDPDQRHLNQFYHCELEMIGTLKDLIPIIEGYIRILCESILFMDNITSKIGQDKAAAKTVFKRIISTKKFPEIDFNEAVDILIKNKKEKYINFTEYGRDITSKGEIELAKILGLEIPIWLKYFDRDRTAFYQKPCGTKKGKTLNADLLFPPIIDGSFGGEIVGAGQRQNNPAEMYESLKRQNNISPQPYQWYIDLRKMSAYRITSGFGMGIERFIAWAIARTDIKDVSIYPRLKGVKTYP